MKKLSMIFLSLILGLSLMLAVFGCGSKKKTPPPIEPPSTEGGGIPEDPDLGNDYIQSFSSAWEAFDYAKNRFENEEENYVTFLSGIASPQGLGGLAGDQKIYSEKYKSSKTNNFLYTTYNYGKKIINMDPSMAFKAYKDSNGFQAQIVMDQYNKTSNHNGVVDNGENASPRYTADFTDVPYDTYTDSNAIINKYGNDPTKLMVYIINQSTIKSVDSFEKSSKGSYTFSFSLNESSVENYKKQVKEFSSYDYQEFKSVSITFTVDKYGRMKRIECKDTYVISYMSTTTIATTVEDIFYGYIPNIEMNRGNPKITLEALKKS